LWTPKIQEIGCPRKRGNFAGRRFFCQPKTNISARQPTLAYRIVVVEVGFDRKLGESIRAPVVQWEGEVDITAEEAIAQAKPGKSNRSRPVEDFLSDVLTGGPVLQTTVVERGAERGFSLDQLRRAKEKLGVNSCKEPKFEGRWAWRLIQGGKSDEDEKDGE
jgi:hypothetical protein